MGFIITLVILFLLFGLGFALTGALLKAIFWVCVKLPCAILLLSVGLALCCTILLIPIGIGLFKTAVALIF